MMTKELAQLFVRDDRREKPPATRKVASLHADWETNKALRDWAESHGFDLGWTFGGWPQHSDFFNFHVTLVASKNKIAIDDQYRSVNPVTVQPKGFDLFGKDNDTPVMLLEQNDSLDAMREFFVDTLGFDPTYPDYKPHLTLSYRWNGEPKVMDFGPVVGLPELKFSALVVSTLDDVPAINDKLDIDYIADQNWPVEGRFTDAAQVMGTRLTKDGYMVADCRVARTGIQEYAGFEVGLKDKDVVRVYRPPQEVFSRDSLGSYAYKPVTDNHPSEDVTAKNWRDLARGQIGGDVVRDGQFVRVPLVLMDQSLIDAVKDGKKELSMGYDTVLHFEYGVTPDGEKYDAIQRGIRINHVAVVQSGRAGKDCRIGDRVLSDLKPERDDEMSKKTVIVDGKSIEVTEQAAQVIADLQAKVQAADEGSKERRAALELLNETIKDHTKSVDEQLKSKDAEIEDLKKQVPTSDELDKMIADRAALHESAKKVCKDLDVKGKDAPAIRKAVVVEKLGDEAVKDRSDDYIEACFDRLVADADKDEPDPLRDANKRIDDAKEKANMSARDKYLEDQGKAWQQ